MIYYFCRPICLNIL